MHQTAMCYEDRPYGSGFSRVMLRALPQARRVRACATCWPIASTPSSSRIDPTRAAALTGKGGNAAWLQDALCAARRLAVATREAA